ncbi:MAG TPA: hypothetical protein VGR47_03495 [Terracidiphilus sp.]|nr:hypothetical protein [Terracidiphilus sp.]
MNCSQVVLTKLTEIERSIGVVDTLSLRRMIIETQDYILQNQKESMQQLRQRPAPAAAAD